MSEESLPRLRQTASNTKVQAGIPNRATMQLDDKVEQKLRVRRRRMPCPNFWRCIANEFQWSNLQLSQPNAHDFFRSQWQRNEHSLSWLIYRWLTAVFFTGGTLSSAYFQFFGGRWFIYVTDWGLILLMCVNIFGALLATAHYLQFDIFDHQSICLKFYWALHYTTLETAVVISFVFWVILFPYSNLDGWAIFNLMGHCCNSLMMLLDHMLVAFPTRILHTVYPLAFSLLYAIFSLVFYLADGTDQYGNHFVYEILYWHHPEWCLVTLFCIHCIVWIVSFFLFGLYRLRVRIYTRTLGEKLAQAQRTIMQV